MSLSQPDAEARHEPAARHDARRADVITQAGPGAYALLTDGTTIEIRAARPGDFAAVRDMHCFGVANTAISLNATFAARHPRPGMAGLALQCTGGTGFVLLEHLSRLGVGISTLVSLGDKDDVSGTDMLLWWESDPATKLALLYLESLGNPPKFTRTARRVGRSMPVLTVNVSRSASGLRMAAIRAAAAATPQLTRQALLEQAGVIAAANLGELLDAAALLASQPVPAGGRVGVVSNTRGGGVLAADACGDAGLQVASLTGQTQQALRDLLPSGAAVAGPVDTTAVA